MELDKKKKCFWDLEEKINEQIAEVEKKGLINRKVNPRLKFNLDSSKLAFHEKRVEAWIMGERIAPITIDMALTQKCSYSCKFCYANLQQNPSVPAKWEVYESFLNDCVEIGHKQNEGVKAISLVSDGESTESPHFYKFIKKAKENGIDIAVGTNGLRLKKEYLPEIIRDLTYLRFNFDAGEPEKYSEIMGTIERNYYRVIENIKECVKLKSEKNSEVTIGLQMVLLPEYSDQVIPLARLGRDLGVDYTVIKHCSDDGQGSLGIDYSWYRGELANKLLNVAESLSTENYSVQAKWSKLKTGRDRIYTKCFGTPFHLQMSGSGIVAPCGSFFNQKYKQYHIGNIKEKSFKEIWESEKYWEIMGILASEKFNAKKDCAALCLQDKTNELLWDLIEDGGSLPKISGKFLPLHYNFI